MLTLTGCDNTQSAGHWAHHQWASFITAPEETVEKTDMAAADAPKATPVADSGTAGATTAPAQDAGKTMTTRILKEYTAATGELCRRYAAYADIAKPGKLLTSCRDAQTEQWVDLRPSTHETLAAIAPPISFGTALVGPVTSLPLAGQ